MSLRRSLLALVCVLWAAPVWAQVNYETSLAPIGVSFLAAGEIETHAFDAGTGANRVLLVYVNWNDKANTISGVTYNSVAMTSLGAKVTQNSATPDLSGQLWRLIAPASGINNIAVTMGSGTGASVGQISAWVGNNVHQTTPTSDYTTNGGRDATGPNTVSSVTVPSEANDRVVIFMGTGNNNSSITATATNYTERQDAAEGNGFSTELGDAAGSASIAASATWSNGAFAVNWVALGVSLNPVAAAGGCTGGLLLLGAGKCE